jgi:hypothetical protein
MPSKKYNPIYVRVFDYLELYDKDYSFPEHESIIRPLLDNCLDSHIYVEKNNDAYINNKDILIEKKKGVYKFNVSKECIKGREALWNYRQRFDSMVFIMKEDLDLFGKIFKNAHNPSTLKGFPKSAMKECQEEIKKGNVAVSWHQDYLLIFAKNHDELLELAYNKCKKINLCVEEKLKILKGICRKKGNSYVHQAYKMQKDVLQIYTQKKGSSLKKATTLELYVLIQYLEGMSTGLLEQLGGDDLMTGTGWDIAEMLIQPPDDYLCIKPDPDPDFKISKMGEDDYLLYKKGQIEKLVKNILKVSQVEYISKMAEERNK